MRWLVLNVCVFQPLETFYFMVNCFAIFWCKSSRSDIKHHIAQQTSLIRLLFDVTRTYMCDVTHDIGPGPLNVRLQLFTIDYWLQASLQAKSTADCSPLKHNEIRWSLLSLAVGASRWKFTNSNLLRLVEEVTDIDRWSYPLNWRVFSQIPTNATAVGLAIQASFRLAGHFLALLLDIFCSWRPFRRREFTYNK